MQKNNKLIIIIILISLTLSITFFLIPTNHYNRYKRESIILYNTIPQKITDAFMEACPAKDIISQGDWQLSTFLTNKHAIATLAYDIQAKPILDSHDEYYWMPLGVTTVVIAIDRNQTDISISSWQDLESSRLILGMTHKLPDAGLILASVSRGMTGDEFNTVSLVKILREKYSQGLLQFDNDTTPIQILFDYQAAALIEQGRNLEIIIPDTNGLIYELGLLSKVPFERIFYKDNKDLHPTYEDTTIKLKNSFNSINYLYKQKEYIDISNFSPTRDSNALNIAILSTPVRLDKEITRLLLYTTVTGFGFTVPTLICIIGFAFWIIYTRIRIVQKSASNAISLIGLSMIIWLSIRLIKWQFLSDSIENRFCWYSFYPFMMLMTSSLLWFSLSIGRQNDNGRPPNYWWYLTATQFLLLLLVYSNDLHHLVFIFDPTSLYWNSIYNYGPAFILVYAGYSVPLLIGIVILCVKCWNDPRRIRIFIPLLILALFIAYIVGYIIKLPIAHKSDITIITCLFVAIFSESALRSGLIPNNTKYRHLFKSCTLKIQLLDSTGQAILTSSDYLELPIDIKKHLLSMKMPAELEYGQNSLWFADSIAGGFAVWQEDISQITQLKNDIANTLHKLEETEHLLLCERLAKDNVISAKANEEIYAKLDLETGNLLEEIRQLANELSNNNRMHNIRKIQLLATYIKRRCYFIFYPSKHSISSDAILDIITELLKIIETMGTNNFISSSLVGEIPIGIFLTLYDFIFYFLHQLSKERDLILNCFHEGTSLLCTFIVSADITDYKLPYKLTQSIESVDGIINHKFLEGAQSLTLTIPNPEERKSSINA